MLELVWGFGPCCSLAQPGALTLSGLHETGHLPVWHWCGEAQDAMELIGICHLERENGPLDLFWMSSLCGGEQGMYIWKTLSSEFHTHHGAEQVSSLLDC